MIPVVRRAALALICALAGQAFAQSFPAKPIRIVVPGRPAA